jgi:hypothetical protein
MKKRSTSVNLCLPHLASNIQGFLFFWKTGGKKKTQLPAELAVNEELEIDRRLSWITAVDIQRRELMDPTGMIGRNIR